MIVRNEALVIRRCLESVAPLIDTAVVCDTGSTDGTAAICREFFASRGMPASVVGHRWQNFGANRTRTIRTARAFVETLRWRLEDTYWLFLDADQELVIDADFSRRLLTADAIDLRQRCGTLLYWNLRLARASLAWRSVGPTHERYECAHFYTPSTARLSSLWIRHHGDGGSRARKFVRDIGWLTKQLDRQPGDPRTLFYLAQSYRAVGDHIKALRLYQKRIAAGGSGEELWYAKFAIGQMYARAGHFEAGRAALQAAHDADRQRAEPLHELARLYRRHGKRYDAAVVAQRARAIPFPATRHHFVHADVYEHGIEYELALAAAGTPAHQVGFDACERLAHSRTAPHAVVADARRLAVAYAEPLQGVRFLPLRPQLPAPFKPCNPSILRTSGGYMVSCRAVNYEQRRLRYRSLESDGVYRTRNVLMRLNREFEAVDQQEIVVDEPPLRTTRVQGLEDCRLFETTGARWIACVTTDRHPSGQVHQSVWRLDEDHCRVASHRALVGPLDDRPQKNWLPFEGADGQAYALYGYDPMTVLRISMDLGRYEVAGEVDHPLNAKHWRGSAGPIAWPGRPGRQLLLVHEVVRRQGGDGAWERVYLHRFVECDESFRPTRLSKPFVFAHKGVEFACGMTASHDTGAVIVGVGIEDREAYLCGIPIARVDAMLGPAAEQGWCRRASDVG